MEIDRVLVTGASGMVGSYVAQVFSNANLVLTDVVDTISQLDVSDPGVVMEAVQTVCPDVVLHLAAATDVDRCQDEPDYAYSVNAIGTQNVALACQATGAVLVYVSTGNVFSGEKTDLYNHGGCGFCGRPPTKHFAMSK